MFKYILKNYLWLLQLQLDPNADGWNEYDYKTVKNKVWIMSAWQLALLALQDAYRKKIEVVLLADKEDSPASLLINPDTKEAYVKKDNIIVLPQIEYIAENGDTKTRPDWMDFPSLKKFVEKVWTENPITLEWENVPYKAVEYIESLWAVVFPNSWILKTIQDRSSEKRKIQELWGKTVEYWEVNSIEMIEKFIEDHWWIEHNNFRLKSRRDGYDWKWQTFIKTAEDVKIAFESSKGALGNGGLIIEKDCDLAFEASVIVSREADWSIKSLEPIFNIHENGILKTSIAPTDEYAEAFFWEWMKEKLMREAEILITNWKGYKWILTVEFFVNKQWDILVNEVAPRTHNSGHATINPDDEWVDKSTSQNELWLNSVSWRITDVIRRTQTMVMRNILTPQKLKDYIDKSTFSWGLIHSTVYDYLKYSEDYLLWIESRFYFDVPDWIEPRKAWHENFYGKIINELLVELKKVKKDKKMLLKKNEIDENEFLEEIKKIEEKEKELLREIERIK